MIEVAAAVIRKDGKILLCSRPADKPPAGWEFPGGKLEPGESCARAAERELQEELALPGKAGKELFVTETPKIRLHFIEFFPNPGAEPVPQEHQCFFWYPFPFPAPEQLLPNDLLFWNFLSENFS